jgi:hypothetical protein
MTNPGLLLAAVISAMRSIGPLVTELGEDESNIYAYTDAYPAESRIINAIYSAPRPSIMVAYGGLVPGEFGRNEVDKHKFLGYFRSKEEVQGDYGFFNMLELLVDGICTDGNAFRYSTIHENCYPPDRISFKRVVHLDADYVDYWEFSFLLTEIGG